MKPRTIIEYFAYSAIVVLSLIVLWLLAIAPASILDARVVYQGF